VVAIIRRESGHVVVGGVEVGVIVVIIIIIIIIIIVVVVVVEVVVSSSISNASFYEQFQNRGHTKWRYFKWACTCPQLY